MEHYAVPADERALAKSLITDATYADAETCYRAMVEEFDPPGRSARHVNEKIRADIAANPSPSNDQEILDNRDGKGSNFVPARKQSVSPKVSNTRYRQ